MSIEEWIKLISQIGALPMLAVFCYLVYKTQERIRSTIHAGNNNVQDILVMAMTGELKSVAQWREIRAKKEREGVA